MTQVDQPTATNLAETLRRQLNLVARLRAGQRLAQQRVNELRSAFEQEHQAELEQPKSYAADLEAAERTLRALALASYARDGDKHPAEGIGIQIRKRMDYEPEAAVVWAAYTGRHHLLDIKTAAFERSVRGLDMAGELPDFVTLRDKPAATIATDLSGFVAAEPVPICSTETFQ